MSEIHNLKYDDIPKIEFSDIDLEKQTITTFSHSFFLYDENRNDEIVDIGAVNYLQILIEGDNGKVQMPIYEDMVKRIYTDEEWKKFNNYIYGLGKMNRLSEEIFDQLKKVIKGYLVNNKLEEILDKNSDCRKNKNYLEKEFHRLTFNELKNILSCILKTDDDFNVIEGVKNKNEVKNFSKIFQDYILNRDYYTHGKLYILYPDEKPILKIQERENEKYIEYKKEDFINNLKVFMYLKTILNDIYQIIQNRNIKQ